MPAPRIIHLTAADVSVIVLQDDDRLPVILHWGALIDATDAELASFAEAEERPGLSGISDLPYRPSVLPEHSAGWFGRQGVELHRAGAVWAPRFAVRSITLDGTEIGTGVTQASTGLLVVSAEDEWGQIGVMAEIDLTSDGLLRMRVEVRNAAAPGGDLLDLQAVTPALTIPTRADEVLDFSGRWAHERIPQRREIVQGVHSRQSRRGRTGLDATTVMAAGVKGFSAGHGEVWLCHVGFSGGHEHALERSDGHLAFRGGEVLLPGEVRLAAGETYTSPWIFGSYGIGLDSASARFHNHVRATSRASRRPRPATLNVWEAVYFEQDHGVITALAEQAADLGIERFVLDDGWFLGRKNDRAGLGDWSPDPGAWPDGLRPLADRVRELGMEFGLWVEPEMVNEDSDLARAHPDWILRARPELPPLFRFQQVLDLTNPDAYAHILGVLDGLVSDIGVAYLKWDHNRDLIEAGHPGTGTAAVHEQTLALYRLIDELRERHPELEIESCASGGGRVDLGILERTDRVHPSDSHDPVDRFHMLRWTGLLVPPEMLGSHVASAVSSTTGRTHDLHLRCAVAFLGHFGIEWDIRGITQQERDTLREWIAVYRRLRDVIQTGRQVAGGEFDPAAPTMRGVVAHDATEGLYTIITPPTTADTRLRVRFPGLDDRRRYRLTVSRPESVGPPWQVGEWLRDAPTIASEIDEPNAGTVYSGSMLSAVGLEFPTFHPDRAAVVHLRAVD